MHAARRAVEVTLRRWFGCPDSAPLVSGPSEVLDLLGEDGEAGEGDEQLDAESE